AFKPKAASDHATARRFQHGHVHQRILQHELRTYGAGTIPLHQQAIHDIHAITTGHAHLVAVATHDVRDQACSGGLPVCAGDGDDGNTTGGTGWEEHVHHGLGNVAPQPFG